MSKSHRPKTNPDSMPDLDAISPASEELSFDDIDIPVPVTDDAQNADAADEFEIDPDSFATAPLTVTLPAAISASAARRERMPQSVKNFCKRICSAMCGSFLFYPDETE